MYYVYACTYILYASGNTTAYVLLHSPPCTAVTRILNRLSRRSEQVPPPPLTVLRNPLPAVPPSCFLSATELKEHLREDLLFIQGQARYVQYASHVVVLRSSFLSVSVILLPVYIRLTSCLHLSSYFLSASCFLSTSIIFLPVCSVILLPICICHLPACLNHSSSFLSAFSLFLHATLLPVNIILPPSCLHVMYVHTYICTLCTIILCF